MIKILNKHIICSYDTQSLIMHIINAEKFTHKHKIRDQAVHMKSYNLILEFLWLKQINSDIDWWQINWHYHHKVISDENLSIEIVDVKTITNEILTETEIYIMTIDRLVKIMQFNAANHAFSDSHTSDLSHYVWFYVDQFSEELAVKTSIESNAEHVIDLEKEKQSSFRLIYNQFTKKLKALWEYIQKVLDKDWI